MSREPDGEDRPLLFNESEGYFPDDDEEEDVGEYPGIAGEQDPSVVYDPDMDVVEDDDLATVDDFIDRALGVVAPTTWTAIVDVQVLLIRSGRVVLVRRANTGFCDGMWCPPTGRLRALESLVLRAVREVTEVLAVRVCADALRFAHVTHYRSDSDRLVFVFTAEAWQGEPMNAEPHEHESMEWFALDQLPEDTLPVTVAAVDHYRQGRPFSLLNWWW